jgi:hypothetical protein
VWDWTACAGGFGIGKIGAPVDNSEQRALVERIGDDLGLHRLCLLTDHLIEQELDRIGRWG